MPPRLGILAGGGQLPVKMIEACRASGRACFVLAFEGHTDPATVQGIDHAWIRLGAIGEGFRHLRAAGVGEVVMAGPVKRPTLADLKPDLRALSFLAKVGRSALGDDGLLSAVVKEIEAEGFRVIGADEVLAELLAPMGPLGRLDADAEARADIARGVEVVRALGRLDVGQAAIVARGVVLAVEAVEGTDAMLARVAALDRDPGGVLVKIAKPGQERRVDLPSIGAATVARAQTARLAGIALHAGHALVIDRDAVAAAADRSGLFVVGIDGSRDGG